MTRTMPIEEVNGRLVEIVAALDPGDEITLTSKDRPVAALIPKKRRHLRRRGTCKGMLIENPNVPDDVHLEDFKDYL